MPLMRVLLTGASGYLGLPLLDLLDARAAARLFDAAGEAGVRRTVLLSSTSVYRPFSAEMDEGDALVPTDAYGATKAAAELFLRSACASHGMREGVLRPGPIVGPPAHPAGAFRSDRHIAAMVAAARRGETLERHLAHLIAIPSGA